MAQWSLVHMSIDPFISKYIKNPFLNEVAGGAATGAVMEWRNGIKGIATGAFQGALQNVFMSAIGFGIRTVVAPVLSLKQKHDMKKFSEARNKETYKAPFEALFTAFSTKE